MAVRPEFVEFDVGDATLGALRWPGRLGAPILVAVHGITSNAWVWDPLAHHLAGRAEIVALDLRGRGRSVDAPAPYGMRRHADDVAAVIDHLGVPAFVVGHSMGAFVALAAAERHPGSVRDLVLVDGGTPLPCPDGPDVDVDAVLEATLGPGLRRLAATWPDRVSYLTMWSSHPAFAEGISSDLERNLLADLVETDDGFRVAVSENAVRHDGRELLTDPDVRTLLDRRRSPTTIIHAEFGMLGGPPPFISHEQRRRHPQHLWIDGLHCNHYTVLNSAAGAQLVAEAITRTFVI